MLLNFFFCFIWYMRDIIEGGDWVFLAIISRLNLTPLWLFFSWSLLFFSLLNCWFRDGIVSEWFFQQLYLLFLCVSQCLPSHWIRLGLAFCLWPYFVPRFLVTFFMVFFYKVNHGNKLSRFSLFIFDLSYNIQHKKDFVRTDSLWAAAKSE